MHSIAEALLLTDNCKLSLLHSVKNGFCTEAYLNASRAVHTALPAVFKVAETSPPEN